MISFREYVETKMNLKMPHGNIPGGWFYDNQLPMVVRCCCCDMSMASPSAWIDEQGYTYCAECADVSEG